MLKRFFLCSIVCLVLGGCVSVFTQAPVLDSDLELDRRLIGTWVDEDGDSMTIVPHGGFLKATNVPGMEPDEFVIKTGKIGEHNLIIIVLGNEAAPARYSDLVMERTPVHAVYLVMKYEFISQTEFRFTELDMGYIEGLIDQGLIAGTVTNGCPKDPDPEADPDDDAPSASIFNLPHRCPMFDVDARELRPLFLEDNKELFPDDDDLILTRAPS